ncbi:MAG: ROK family protein [Chloroflexi bacterium]|nr:ROK family protein [Chloroflexota bacterium]
MANKAVVGVDLGGTSLAAAVVDPESGEILGETRLKTQPELGALGVTERIHRAIVQSIKKAGLKKKQVLGVGVGVPGPVNPHTGTVVNCANLGPTWDGFPLQQELASLLEKLPVTIDNDVNVGAVGEHTFGAGQGSSDMLAIFVGTGIGGGVIIGGKLYPGLRNSSGEVGHMVIAEGGAVCGCGGHGHAEALASRTAIERYIRESLAAGRESIVPALLEKAGRDSITSGIIGEAWDAGDQVTREAVQRAQYYLGILISACVNLLDPEIVVLGGGVLERMGEEYLPPVREAAQQHYINKSEADRVRIVRATLGDYSGAIGAAILAQQRLG